MCSENGKMSEFFLWSCWYCKTPFGSHIPEEADEGFQFVCFHQGVFFFYLGMRSGSSLSNRSRVITHCLSASCVIFLNFWRFLTSVINRVEVQSRASLEIALLLYCTPNCWFYCTYCAIPLVQMLSKQILQQVRSWWQLFRTSGNASQIHNMHILSL